MSLIEAHELTKQFAGRTAVDRVSFQVREGEIVGLLGSNGAGKSTTMRMLAGTLEPQSGMARIAGHDTRQEPLLARAAAGYLPEQAAGFAHLTPRELVRFVAEARGLPSRRVGAETERVAALCTLAPVLDRRLETLSKGWRQRAWLAQALVGDPRVLILDEPTDGLDPNQKTALRATLRRLAQGKAILLSTHILEEAEQLCDRLVVMSGGRVVADEPRAALTDTHGRLAPAFTRLTSRETETAS
jgi:ABC-2 type transport system ATP-binding protein